MPRHEFRTIEAALKWFQDRIPPESELGACPEGRYACGLRDAYQDAIDLLRSSNLGIVYPPAEQGDKS